MLARDSLGSTMGAFLTGTAVTSGPWLLTTLVLVAMHLSSDAADVADAQRVITLVYAGAIVVGAPIDIVLSRYAADRVYERRSDQIAAPLRRVIAACLLAFAALGAATMALTGAPLTLAIPGTALAAVVAAQWLLLSAAGGLSSPGIILRAFAFGAPVSVAAGFSLSRWLGAAGMLHGFAAGQLITLGVLLVGTLRALPPVEDEDARILPAFRTYWMLAASAFAFYAGLWVDKLVVLGVDGSAAASAYATMAALAWLSVVPACASLFVAVETGFYRRFRAFYASLGTGASLPELETLSSNLRDEVWRTLRGVAAVQASVTLLCLVAAPMVSRLLGLGEVGVLRALVIGAGFQVVALAETLLLNYFDFRREALMMALTQLVASAVLTLVLGAGVGYATACGLTCVVGVPLLRRRMRTLLAHTFLSQPY